MQHPKTFFSKSENIHFILVFLNHPNADIVMATLETLEGIVVDCKETLMSFETQGGLRSVCEIITEKRGPEPILLKCIEMLFVYFSTRWRVLPTQNERDGIEEIEKYLGSRFLKKLLTTFDVMKRKLNAVASSREFSRCSNVSPSNRAVETPPKPKLSAKIDALRPGYPGTVLDSQERGLRNSMSLRQLDDDGVERHF
ncbi:hypothetical protein BC829DRAFT_47221 [Chytridium lagenaria]|nr:hypothetical protein BC829DRAFT_47221 [Chytridium lagenaria]